MVNNEGKNDLLDNFNLDPEMRCNHYVTTDVKKLWSVELDLLEQLKKICQKYDIKYFAADGTLLGAVRHKGFIPWDDDIDIYMLADDYERFCEIAHSELKGNYYLQVNHAFARIRNSATTAVTEADLRELQSDKNYNCGIFIDIFPLHYVYSNKIMQKVQKIIYYIYNRGLVGYHKEQLLKKNPRKYWRFFISKAFVLWKIFNIFYDYEQYLSVHQKRFGICKDSSLVGAVSFYGDIKSRYIWEKAWFKDTIQLPFENTFIQCPKEYHLVLQREYGEYMVFEKGASVHTMVVYDAEVPYKEKLKDYYKNCLEQY